jgi:hypothetical protein
VLQVLRLPEPPLHQRDGPLDQNLREILPAQAEIFTAHAHPGRDLSVEGVRQAALALFEFSPLDPGGQEPHAAVDVEAHATRAYHAAHLRVERRYPAYGEAVPPVDIGHGQRRLDYPWQRRDVGELPQGGVVLGPEVPQYLLGGVERRVYFHLPLAGDAVLVLTKTLEIHRLTPGNRGVSDV